MGFDVVDEPEHESRLRTDVPHVARIYDYLLGGKHHYPADRAVAEEMARTMPGLREGARANRAFLGRAVHHLTAEAGVRQFLDIGTGLPSANNTHEVAQAVAPECRVLYVDNDPLVIVHAQALLTGNPSGATEYLEADVRDPRTILARAREFLDFTQPIALLLVSILHCVTDDTEAYAAVETLKQALPPGSHIVISHATADLAPEFQVAAGGNITLRDHKAVTRFFDGWDLIDPGVVCTSHWRAGVGIDPPTIPGWAGIARQS